MKDPSTASAVGSTAKRDSRNMYQARHRVPIPLLQETGELGYSLPVESYSARRAEPSLDSYRVDCFDVRVREGSKSQGLNLVVVSYPSAKSARGKTMLILGSHVSVSASKRSTLSSIAKSPSLLVKPPMQYTSLDPGTLVQT